MEAFAGGTDLSFSFVCDGSLVDLCGNPSYYKDDRVADSFLGFIVKRL